MQTELPFVVGVLGDFSGQPDQPLPRVKDRKLVEIDRDNFDQVLASMAPRLALRVDNKLQDDGSTHLGQGDVPVIADVILSGEVRALHLSWGVGVRNLFDWRYGYPGGGDLRHLTFVPASGRTFFLQTTLAF